jgi:hypothetical protein
VFLFFSGNFTTLLRDALVSMGNDVQLLDKWYRKDSNKVS